MVSGFKDNSQTFLVLCENVFIKQNELIDIPIIYFFARKKYFNSIQCTVFLHTFCQRSNYINHKLWRHLWPEKNCERLSVFPTKCNAIYAAELWRGGMVGKHLKANAINTTYSAGILGGNLHFQRKQDSLSLSIHKQYPVCRWPKRGPCECALCT